MNRNVSLCVVLISVLVFADVQPLYAYIGPGAMRQVLDEMMSRKNYIVAKK